MNAVVEHNPESVLSLRDTGLAYRRKRGLLRFSNQWAIRNLTFDVQHGETLGVVGHNGAGKSTLLRLLAGIVLPDEGEVITRVQRVALLSLNVGLVKFLTGRENALIGGMLLGASRREMLARLDSIIGYSGLEDFIDQPVSTYSSGMKARLGFSVAFMNDPDILLIDELMGVGDREFKEKSTESMHERIKSDKTVILVSHSNEILRELCNRVIWLERGQLVKIGPAEEVLAEYETTPRKQKNL